MKNDLKFQFMNYPFILYAGEKYLKDIKCCTVKDDGYNNIYDPKINPQMLTEFSGCAFRSLHSTIVDRVMYVINFNSILIYILYYSLISFRTEIKKFYPNISDTFRYS